jgi:excisionase family DNA binding protein
MEQDKIFTTQELAKYLKLNEKTVIKMAQNGHLPGVKIGNQWRFHLRAIDNFLLRDMVAASQEELDSVISSDVDIFPLSRLTAHDLIKVDSKSLSSYDVLSALSKIAYERGLTSSQENLLQELKKREDYLSTAISKGIAIPHPRHPSLELFKETKLIILLSKEGVDFDAPDRKPVYIFFMPCSPNEHIHIRLLAKISKFLQFSKNIDTLMQAKTKDEIMQALMRFDREYMYIER